jgi:hypothetical protein
MWPLSSSVRRRNQACSIGLLASCFGPSFRGANVRAAVRLPSRREMPLCCITVFLRHHRFRAARSAGMGIVGSQAPTNFAGCQFGPCSIRRERQPNNSLKRTVQSLRDWSCRLARSLGVGYKASSVHTACAVWHLARRPLRPPRMPFSTAADHWFVCSSRAQARDSSHAQRDIRRARHPARPRRSAARRTQEPSSSSREQFRAGAGTNQELSPSGLLQIRAPGIVRLTTRSSGPINRFAIDVAA